MFWEVLFYFLFIKIKILEQIMTSWILSVTDDEREPNFQVWLQFLLSHCLKRLRCCLFSKLFFYFIIKYRVKKNLSYSKWLIFLKYNPEKQQSNF